MRELTPKQEAFCQAYIQTGNKSEAYRMAYSCSKMKSSTVNRKAVELFENGNITARIQQLQSEVSERNKITIDELVQSLSGMVRFDISDLYDEYGVLKPIHELPIHARMMISEIETMEEYDKNKQYVGRTKKIKLHKKLDAVEKLMRHLGGYQKDNAQKTSVLVMTEQERQTRLKELRNKLKGGG